MIKDKKGFSLVELLLYISLAGLLFFALFSFLVIAFSGRIKSQAISEAEQQGSQIVQAITQAIRNADSITSPTPGTSGASLTLAYTDIAKNPTVLTLSNNIVSIKLGASNPVPLNSSRVLVSGLTFSNLSQPGTPGMIRTAFTINTSTSTKQEFNYVKNFTASAAIR